LAGFANRRPFSTEAAVDVTPGNDRARIAPAALLYYMVAMKACNFRLPESLIAEIEAESRVRRISKSDVVRDRLMRAPPYPDADPLASIRDLIGSVEGAADLSSRKKEYLRARIRARHNR
jgi:hypothetical protein